MKLKRIVLRSWGPIDLLELEFPASFGVIYGRNERGKTSIMEAVLLSLANSPEEVFSYLRKHEDFVGTSSLELILPDGRVVRRSYPSKRRGTDKVDRIRLMFFWPGEAYQKGLVQDMLTGLILPQEILSWNPLKGLGVEDVREGRIAGAQRGRFREYTQLKRELERVKREEEKFYSLSLLDLLELEDRAKEITVELERLALAKRGLAGRLYQELDEVERELSSLPEEAVRSAVAIKEALDRLTALRKGLEERLKGVISQEEIAWWRSLLSQLRESEGNRYKFLLVGAGVGLILAFILPWWWARLMVGALSLVALFFALRFRRDEEVLSLARERSGREFVNRTQLEEFVKELEKEVERARTIEAQISELRGEEEKEKIRLRSLIGDEGLEEFLRRYQEKKRSLEGRRRELLEALSRLGVKKEEAGGEKGDYDEERERKLQEELERVRMELERRRVEVEGFLSSLAVRYGLSDWTVKEVFVSLKREKRELEARIKELAVEFVSAVAWNRVLSDLRRRQYEEVSEVLNQERFKEYLDIFSSGKLLPEKIKVSEEDVFFFMPTGQEYRFSMLSAGARHQVLFAFKSALLERIYPEGRFVLLDDAFLFSDDDRLKENLRALLRLTEMGWQVIYLTSDGQTRDYLKELGAEEICL